MTSTEKQEIIDAVIAGLRTNSLQITDLTEVSSAPADAYIELSGGRRVQVSNLVTAVVAQLEGGNVTSTMLADACVTAAKIANGAVTADKIGSGAVGTAKIADGSVTTAKLAAEAVTLAKIASSAFGSVSSGNTGLVKGGDVYQAIASEATARQDADTTLQGLITALGNQLATMKSGGSTDAIENFDEVIAFLAGIDDDETLAGILSTINSTFESLHSAVSRCLKFVPFEEIVNNVSLESQSVYDVQHIVYDNTRKMFLARIYQAGGQPPKYYNTFINRPDYMDEENEGIRCDRIFYHTRLQEAYRSVDGEDIVPMGITHEELNNSLVSLSETLSGLIDAEATARQNADDTLQGQITSHGTRIGALEEAMSSMSSVAGIYNVTNEIPVQGYYVLCDAQNPTLSAVHAVWNAQMALSGLIISFEISAGIWKTYQYIGRTVTEVNWKNADNWKDFGSLAAGSETYIIIDEMIGAPIAGEYYTLESAVARLVAYQQETGVNYAKKGLIISYRTGENVMETKQFQGEVTDFGEVGLWKDFGGGGSEIETSDEPEEDGEDAFSTGGAYKHLPAGINVDTETEGVVKLQLANAEGEGLGDEIQFSVGSGGGGGSGTIVSMAFQTSPMYGNAGSDFILRAAVRSITTVGSTEQENTIATIDLYDRDTNMMLERFTFNKASSASMTTYDFVMDVSKYFTSAGVRRFKCLVTDDAGNTGSRNVNVTAVDVTVQSVQTLQYTQSTSLVVGGSAKNIPVYQFPRNVSDRGITAITEIYLNGQWRELGRAVITDSYSHGITIDPTNCLGSVLSHGAYPIRVHGVDVSSGVVGNYLYSGIFVIDDRSTTPLVVESWVSAGVNASVKLYETITVNYAVYDPTNNAPTATVYLDGTADQSHIAYRSSAYTYTHQVSGVAYDGTFSHIVKVGCGASYGVEATFLVSGTVIDALLKAGAIYGFDFANRSNDEADHTITNNGYEITVNGSNWSTTGFKMFLGEKALRIAEDVTASLDHQPYNRVSIESTGMAVQFAFASANLVDDDAVLMSCFNEGVGAGFFVTGRHVGIYCSTGLSNQVEQRAYKQGEKVTVAVVVEPAAEGLGQTRAGTTYYFIKLYLNGEEVAVIGYVAGQSNLIQNKNITFDGTYGDFYLYYILAWDDYFQFDQAFQNYLVKLTDTGNMVVEYNNEDVMASQQVTEQDVTTTKLRPQASELAERGMAYIIECPYNNSDIEALDNTTSTKQNNYVTLYYIDPARPWTNFVARDVRRRNQGTTSAKRPVKNPRYYLAQKNGSTYDKTSKTGGTTIELLNPDNTTEAGRRAIALAAINKVQIHDDSIPVDIITVKVDYSDSSNANDCGVCDQMNATFRALGSNYMTPAQRAFDGTWKKGTVELDGLVMNHSTANMPIAMYRSKSDMGSSPYFHAKGNWKEDKNEQVALGFNDVPGYNKGCMNYGDFVEFYGKSAAMLVAEGETGRTTDESLSETKARFLATSGLDTTKTYVLTQYCGSSYKVMEHNGTSWVEQTGSMVQNANGKWTVTGSVVNPVEGFELLNYQGMDWFKGVSSVADLMAPSTSFSKWVQALIDDGDISAETVPAWTYYFESLVDDDDLAIAYALGKKVPYNLFRWMQFCDSCDWDTYHSTDGDGGTARLNRWKTDMYKYASPHSCFAYDIFTDYDAAVDQRAKNMQPMWFLEDGCKVVNGVYYNADDEANDTTTGMLAMRMYLNKVYDCDTCNGKDNDGGQTVDAEVDPNKLPDEQTGYTNPYAGYNSVLFRNMYLQQTVYVDANSTELSLRTVASAMRSCTTTVSGVTLKPFSPDGALYFFVDSRIKRWQKKVSSYDGERKYIDFTATSDAIYFYALQGLGLTSLPAFIERRWRIRDGFYGTGDFFSGVLSGRVNAPNGAKIRITAAKTGYFGIGNDSSGSLSESVYLEAGESHNFTNFSHEEGALLYIYQADRMSMIDLSEITLSNNFDFSVMTLVEEIYIGKVGKVNLTIGAYTLLTNLNLGELPFLKKLDVRETLITNVVCSGCPRLESLYAAGSQLVRADIADGAKVTYMQLPATYEYLKLRYLPELTLSGLILADASSVKTLIVENCAKIDAYTLLNTVAGSSGSRLSVVRALPIAASGNGNDLATWVSLNMTGLDVNLNAQSAPAIDGTYMLTKYADASVLASWQAALSELTIHQAQYTMIEYDDAEANGYDGNIRNLDNNTKDGVGSGYAHSGHISIIYNRLHMYSGIYDEQNNKMLLQQVSDEDYRYLANGNAVDVRDSDGMGRDFYLGLVHYWYKGINDHLHQKKYVAFSSLNDEPLSTSSVVRRKTNAQALLVAGKAVQLSNFNVGDTFDVANLSTNSSNNVCSMDVSGMKQVRWTGVSSPYVGAIFLDADGKVLSAVQTYITNVNSDFILGEYLFVSVPDGASTFVFTCPINFDSLECIAVDSSEIEAIEPDWVEHDFELIGTYMASIDVLSRMRSIAGKTPLRGNGTSSTASGWTYDSNGNVTNQEVPTINNYTCKDLLNLARMRGNGFFCMDYEQHKDIANLWMAVHGRRNSQAVNGDGVNAGTATGGTDLAASPSPRRETSTGRPRTMCLEDLWGNLSEWMDHVAVNVTSFAAYYKNKSQTPTGSTSDYIFRIQMRDGSERAVQSLAGQTEICRVRNGRFADLVPSKFYSNSNYDDYYCDYGGVVADTGRAVSRSGSNASASNGVVFVYANYASSSSYTFIGARLAFRGQCEITD